MLAGITLILEWLILMFLQSSGVEARPVAWMAVLITVFSVSYLFGIARSRRLRPVAVPLALGYAMRIFLVAFDLYGRNIYSLPNSGADSEWFYIRGLQYANGYLADQSGIVPVVGTLFRWLGDSRIYVQFLLMLCSVVALHMAVQVVEELGVDQKTRRNTMYILCLLPNFAILSSIFLRESIVTMFISISLLCFVRWWNGRTEGWLLLAFIFVLAASWFHSGSVGVAVGYVMVLFVYNRKQGAFHLSWKTIGPALLFLLLFVYLFNNYADTLFQKMAGLDSAEDIANLSTTGGASYAAYVGNSNSIFNILIYTPLRIVFFLFSPFPWQIRGLSDIIALCFNSLFYLYVIVRTISFISKGHSEKRKIVIALFIVAMTTAFVFGWGVANTGTAIRHRDKMVIVYGVLLSLTSSIQGARKTARKETNIHEGSGTDQHNCPYL